MFIRTRIFELNYKQYGNLSELVHAMGISVSQIYRVRDGKRHINEKFIIVTVKAFPRCANWMNFFIKSPTANVTLMIVKSR